MQDLFRPLTRAELKRLTLLALTACFATIIVFRQAKIPQDPNYHQFADERSLFGISNFWNVVSNAPFLFVGLYGILGVLKKLKDDDERQEAGAWLCLFVGVFFAGIGSAWYHLTPNNTTLVWDRLPMSIGFMGLFAAVIADRVSKQAYRMLLLPLVGIGMASVIAWYASELRGAGDLRLYILVQFFPLLTIPLMMVAYRPRYSHSLYIIFALAMYGAAKLCEHFDGVIYDMTGGIFGGHALKHICAAIGCYFLAVGYLMRRKIGE